MEQSVDIVDLISSLLESGKYKEALSIPDNPKLKESFNDNCWDLIAVIIGKIKNDTIVIKPSLHGACEELLNLIIHKAVPEEALLEFIEQIELAKNDAQFGIILNPLQQLLQKLTAKRGRSLEWCLNSISTYIEGIPVPEYGLEDKEQLLMDSDPNVRRISKVYTMLPPFYGPFIKELNDQDGSIYTKQIINAFLISLLGKPLIYIDMDPETSSKSEIRQCCHSIVKDICFLEKNIFKFLTYLEICYKEINKPKSKMDNENDETSPYDQREKMNMTTLSSLYYVVYSGHFELTHDCMPSVYNIEYIVNNLFLAVIHLLNFSEYGPLAKGMALCKALLDHYPTNVSQAQLSPAHYDLSKCLSNVAIYSTYESIRKNAVNMIGDHIKKFEYKGRCMLIKNLLGVANHSGMIGYTISLFKNSVDEAFKETNLPECFKGPQLFNMIQKMCHLPHGAESDLVELADQIITALNFLRYLALKDTDNITGIRDCFSMIEAEYLAKLRTGLNMSKAHYEVKLRDIEEGKDQPEGAINIAINVGGNILDKIPTENKKEIIYSALNAFHLIEGLVARLSECININKMSGLTMECE
ncbi:glomulin-like isoform X1 [Plodia interpunctella]|uniref:glomulin-like isoform X1 n=1 Tax=Plodia interpunctella TaxID=58824 RepID=UPI00236858A4|nr:glomulin-like isoform X1 [Plodia interpunctella]